MQKQMYLENTCRTCLRPTAESLHPIYNPSAINNDVSLAQKLIAIANITVAESDGYPSRVCELCRRKISEFYAFKYQIEHAHRTLVGLTSPTSSGLKLNGLSGQALKPTPKPKSMADGRKETNSAEDIKVEVDICIDECAVPAGARHAHRPPAYRPPTLLPQKLDAQVQALQQAHAQAMPMTTTYTWPTELNEFVFPSIWTNLDENAAAAAAAAGSATRAINAAEAPPQPAADHTSTAGSPGKFVCDVCNACFVRKYSYTLHCQQNICTKRPHKCDLCGRFFDTEQHLLEHSTSHGNQSTLTCFKCKMAYPTMEELGGHMKSAHNWMYQCAICKRAFQSDSHLRRHQRVHTEEKPFECNICQKKFAWAETLKRHLGRHEGKKTVRCQYCDWMFLTRDECRKHERVHTGEKLFVCEYCNSRFGKSSNLTIHLRTHTGERPFACDFCPMRFTVASTRDKHRRMHTGEKPFKCKLCNGNFTQKSSLLAHRRKCTGLE